MIIHVVAPSSPMVHLSADLVNIGVERLQHLGFKVRFGDSCQKQFRHLAGTSSVRCNDILIGLNDDDVCGVMSVYGGYNSNELLDELTLKLSEALISRTPKWFIGYSDITSLSLILSQYVNITALHGPGFASFCDPNMYEFSINSFISAINHNQSINQTPGFYASDLWYTKKNWGPREQYNQCDWIVYKPGEITAPITGGNIDTISSMLGTRFQPITNDKILFLEDTTGEPGLFHRNITQLKQAGIIEHCKGIILGKFPAGSLLDDKNYLFDLLDLLQLPDYPILLDVHCSHVDPMLTIPLNKPAKLVCQQKPELILNYLVQQ